MSEADALTDIANAVLRLRHAFKKHGLKSPVGIVIEDQHEMSNVGMMLRSSTRFDYLTDLDSPRAGGEVAVSVCGMTISAKAGPEMRRVSTIAFHEGLPLPDEEQPPHP